MRLQRPGKLVNDIAIVYRNYSMLRSTPQLQPLIGLPTAEGGRIAGEGPSGGRSAAEANSSGKTIVLRD